VFIKIYTFEDTFVSTGTYYLELLYLVLVVHISNCQNNTYTHLASYITPQYSSCQNSRVV